MYLLVLLFYFLYVAVFWLFNDFSGPPTFFFTFVFIYYLWLQNLNFICANDHVMIFQRFYEIPYTEGFTVFSPWIPTLIFLSLGKVPGLA